MMVSSLITHLVVLHLIGSLIMAYSFVAERQTSAYQQGHVIFGGLFPAHVSWRKRCADVNMEGITLIEAMIYTINKVNTESVLPWNLTLGFDIRDTCNVKEIALKNTLGFLSGERYTSINEDTKRCGASRTDLCHGKLISIIGAGSTELSVAVNKVLSGFNIPQVGYASTSGILSDKSRFPSFSRTAVVGSQRPKVIAKLLDHFGWRQIALLVSNDLYWKSLSLEFKNLASESDICIEIDEVILQGQVRLESIVRKLNKTQSLQIIVMFASQLDTTNIIKQASVLDLTGKVWINTELLSPDVAIRYAHILQGMLVIEREPESVNKFAQYFASLLPIKNTWNPWFRDLWQKIFGCTFRGNLTSGDPLKSMQRVCTGTEEFGWVRQVLSFSNALHVIDAVMAATHVIKNICHESKLKSPKMGQSQEQCLKKLTKVNILSQMFKGPFVFQSLFNRTVSLDKNGDAVSSYLVLNLKKDKNIVQFHKVGAYKTQNADNFTINNNNIQWPKNYKYEPTETWGTPCKPGTYKGLKGSGCQWQCKACADGTFSKEINAAVCVKCPAGTKPNSLKTSCISKVPEFFSWGSSGGGTLTAMSMTSFFLSMIIFCVFLRYKNSAVVSGWGSDVNYYLLWSIAIGVLVPFAFIGYPTDIMCKLQAILVATTLTLSISLVLVKIKQITCKKKYMVSRWQVLSYAQRQTIFALFLTIVESFFCVLWIIINPPKASTRKISDTMKMIMCTSENSSWYVLLAIYIFSITFMITLRSCKARDRSFNFSEAKFICFAMFTLYVVWGVYLAVFFFTSVGLHHITILCLTVVATQMVLLGFIFAPKVFILFWRPEMGKNCEFQTSTLDGKPQMSFETENPRYLHPNGVLRSGSPVYREDSSRGTPSQLSLELPSSRPQSLPQSPPPENRRMAIINQIYQLPCCAGIMNRDDDSIPSNASEQLHPNQIPRRLPLIMIDEGTRSNSTRSQISEAMQVSPRTGRHAHSILGSSFDPEQELVRAAMDDDTSDVWNKRRSDNRSGQRGAGLDSMSQGEYCLRFALNDKVVERRNNKCQPTKDVKIRESRL